jgi:hypothetical protein
MTSVNAELFHREQDQDEKARARRYAEHGRIECECGWRGNKPDLDPCEAQGPLDANEVEADGHCPNCGRVIWGPDDSEDGIDPYAVLDAITETLDGQEWSSDTLDAIATILREAGYPIRDQFHAGPPAETCDACEQASEAGTCCGDVGPPMPNVGYAEKGHAGPHIACGGPGDHRLATWEAKP